MSGVKAQSSREPARGRPMSAMAPRVGEPRDMESEREKLREVLSARAAPTPAPSAAAPEPPPTAASSPPSQPPDGSGQPLAPATRRAMESAFDTDFGDVRVHTSPRAGAAAEALGARAFTVGSDVVFARGRYRPGVPSGERLIAHELAHVVQQRRAGASGLALFPEVVSSPSHPAEREAERAASLAVRGHPVPALTPVAGVVLRDADGADTDASAGAVPVRPMAGSVQGLLEEGREAVARQGGAVEALLPRLVTLLVVGDAVVWYESGGRQVDAFVIRSDATIWASGWYLATASEGLRLVELNGQRGWEPQGFDEQDGDVAYVDRWLQPDDARRFSERVARQGDLVALVGIPSAAPGGDAGSVDASKAERLVGGVRELLAKKADGEGGDEDVSPPERRAVPDRLVVWSSERGAFVNVWVDGAHTALPVADDETVDGLLRRVEDATEALRESRDAAGSTRVASGASRTGFTARAAAGAAKPDAPVLEGSERVANAPAYPARIVNHGPDITVTGATSRFEMQLDYALAGWTTLDQVAARLQPISYTWDLFEVTDVRPEARGDLTYRAPRPEERLSRMGSQSRDFERELEAIGEDTRADVDDALSGSALEVAATWPARSAWLGVVGLSNVVRLGKASISSYIDLVSLPRSEQGIGWDREGEFLLRCVATPSSDESSVIRRASSVATFAVKVVDVNRRAAEVNERGQRELRRLEAERDAAEGEAREQLDARIAGLRRAETATAAELGGDAVRALEQRLAVADRLASDEKAGTPREQRSAEARLLDVQLELQGIPLGEYQRELRAQKEGMAQRMRLIAQVDGRIPGRDFRPHVTLVSEETGQVNELIMMLGEAEGSREGARHYLVADVTAPSPRDRYVFEGRSTQPGAAGHAEAVRRAFVDFRENNGYGRGTLAIRLPEALEEAAGGPLGVEPRMRSAPGSRARVMQRLMDLATVAEIAGLFLTGPVGLAVGAAGAVAGAIVAVDSLSRRHSAGVLRWDFETIMDVSSIVGGVAGVAAPTLAALRNVPRWASRVERLQGMLHIYGLTQLGSTVIVIPVQLEMQLAELEKQKGQLSPGELAARRAEAILGAVRSGLMTAGSAAQLLHPGDTGGTRRAWETDAEPSARVADVEPGGPAPGDSAGVRALPDGEPRVSPEGEGGAAPRPDEPTSVAREPEGEARGPRDGAEAVPATRPPAVSERALRLEAELGDLRGQVSVVELGPPELTGASTRVRYRNGRFQLEVGPDAGPLQIRTHRETARLLLRYQGPIGHIRRLLSRITQLFTRIPGYGTQGFESRLEVRKLNGVISELEAMQRDIEGRIERLGGRDGAALAREADSLQRQIDDLRGQLHLHELLVDSLEPGQGVVAAFDKRFVSRHPALKEALTSIEVGLDALGEVSLTALIERVSTLQEQGRVVGFEDWVRQTALRAKESSWLIARMAELGRVELESRKLAPGERLRLQPEQDPGGASRGVALVVERPQGAGAALAHVRETWEAEAFKKLQLDERQLPGFEALVDSLRARGNEPRSVLAKMDPAKLRDLVEKETRILGENERRARHALNKADPLRPQLAHGYVLEDNIFLHYESTPSSERERAQAKELQRVKREELHLFGDDASSTSGRKLNDKGREYPGIDGTLGWPPRPIQLKGVDEKGHPNMARHSAEVALTKAIAAGIHGVEVYIRMYGATVEQVVAAWDAPPPAHADSQVNGPVFSGDVVSRIEIQCTNGRLQVGWHDGAFTFTRL